jgi:23S rRNA pseudouridine955/2504/2580 synthase/23S rRNA pseudouridine1911/1915/1917 synthase
MKQSWHLSRRSRLIDALKERIDPTCSARALKRALEANACRVNGRVERFASAQLEKGDLIELAAIEKTHEAKPIYTALFEDEDLLILNKPVQSICNDAFFQKALKRRVWLAHRLDKDTTGVLLFGKSPSVAKELQNLFEERTVEKEYLALVDGVPRQSSGTIRSNFIKKRIFEGQTIWGSSPAGTGLYAETSWEIQTTLGTQAALLRCRPKTGRTHQIRVHLSEMNHPILIDRQYASHFRSSIFAARPLLHASRLQFSWKGSALSFEAPLPIDFSNHL